MALATIERRVIHRPAPSRVTSVTLSQIDKSPVSPLLEPAQCSDVYIAANSSLFKIAPRPRGVANVDGEVSAVAVAQWQATQAMSAFAIKWKALLLDRTAGRRARDLSKTVEPVMQALLAYGPAAIDLRGLPVDRVNGMHLAVVLRATFSRKAQTPGWDQALVIAQAALQRDNISVASALGGLL